VLERWRGNFDQSQASRQLQQQLSQARFNTNRRGAFQRPGGDLSGRGSLGRASQGRTFANGNRIAEAVGFYTNGVMQRAAQEIYQRITRERLSAKFPKHQRGKRGGVRWVKLPLSAGLRNDTGKLQGSLRVRAFTPGTSKKAFRGVYRILSQIGGPSLGAFDYAFFHEKKGRLQFMRVTGEEYKRIRNEIVAGATQIALRAGARVS
jgi:hypothetical protein